MDIDQEIIDEIEKIVNSGDDETEDGEIVEDRKIKNLKRKRENIEETEAPPKKKSKKTPAVKKYKNVDKLDEFGNRIPLLDSNGKQQVGEKGLLLWEQESVEDKPKKAPSEFELFKKKIVEAYKQYSPETLPKNLSVFNIPLPHLRIVLNVFDKVLVDRHLPSLLIHIYKKRHEPDSDIGTIKKAFNGRMSINEFLVLSFISSFRKERHVVDLISFGCYPYEVQNAIVDQLETDEANPVTIAQMKNIMSYPCQSEKFLSDTEEFLKTYSSKGVKSISINMSPN